MHILYIGLQGGVDFILNVYKYRHFFVIFVAYAFMVAVFLADLKLPLGIAAGVPYIGAIIVAWWLPEHRHVFALAIIASILTLVGYFYSPAGGDSWAVFINRGVALFAIWSVAYFVYISKKAITSNDMGEVRLKDFTNYASDWLWETDAELRFTHMSDRVEEVTGVPVKFHLGKTREELAGEDFYSDKWKDLRTALAVRKPFKNFEYSRKGPDGDVQYLSTSGVPVYSDLGSFLGYRGSGSDISKQKRTLDRAVKAEEQLRTAIDALEDGFVIYDSDDRLLLCNEKYREIYHESRDALIKGANFKDILRYGAERGQYPEAEGRIDEWIEDRMRLHLAADTEVEQKLPDGKWLKISERPTPDGGIVGFRVDISQLKSAQEKAETANLAKSNFLSTMSHEIRTPLNGVLGLAQLLKDTKLDDDQYKKVNTILSSGQTLLSIINDVLDMSKIEAGGIELEEQAFSLKNLVSTILTPFQSLADDKGIKLIVSSGLDMDDVVKGDPVRLRQILWNLLSNAIKFTDSGHITLTIQTVSNLDTIENLVLIKKNHILYFAIEDTGAGISSDRVGAIFDAFTQEDSSITRKHGGTGLGLSIVKQLAELMGGKIFIQSELGIGSKFLIYLPFDEASKEEIETISLRNASPDIQRSDPLKILLAEDNEVNAVIAIAFLEKFGHYVHHVENGKLAVEAAKDDWAELILMDIHMPEMDGIDATKAIRTTELGRTLPIVGLTAEAFADRHAHFRRAGMNDVLTKPFTEQQLADMLAANRQIDSLSTNEPKGPGNNDVIATDAAEDDLIELTETSASDGIETSVGDEVKLAELRTQLPAEVILNLLLEAQSSLQTRLEELQHGIQIEDSKTIREAAHSIKGSSGSMFAIRVSELAAKLEEASDDIAVVQYLMPDFEVAAQDVLEWWREKSA